MIAIPVAWRNCSQTDLGRCSPAETQRRRFLSVAALPGGQHGPVGGGRGGQHGHAVGRDRIGQLGRGGALDEQRRRARAEREQQQAAEPVGEAERGSAGEDVVPARPDHVPGEGVGGGQHVPVEVHGHLGLPGRARGGGEHGHVVGGGVHRGERAVLGRAAGGEITGAIAAVQESRQLRRPGRQVGREAVIAQGQARLGQPGDGGDLPRAQQGHGGDRDPAGLDHGEPGRGEPGVVRTAEQDPVARPQAEVLGQHLGQLAGPPYGLAVGPGLGGAALARGKQAGTAGAVPGGGGVEELGGAVEPFGIVQPREGRSGTRATGPVAGGGRGRRCRRAPKGKAASLHFVTTVKNPQYHRSRMMFPVIRPARSSAR